MHPLLALAAALLIDRAPCTLPTADPKFICERLTYSSEGLAVHAYLYRPRDRRTLPLVVFNRGGYTVKDQLPLLAATFHRLAQAGFAVLAPMYRGSEGAPGHDEMGGADLADLHNVLPLAKELGGIDTARVVLYGESRGGIMCLLALRDGFPARAAAIFGTITDLGAYLDSDPRAGAIANTVWPGYEKRKQQIVSTRSAIRWPERIDAPLLLMHGGADRQVPLTHTLNLADRLEQLNRPYRVTIFGGDLHTLPANRVERDRQAAAWFHQHLQ